MYAALHLVTLKQGNKAEDLPEHILCCMRLNELDYTNYKQLGF
jgi:hypothetical protein